MTTGGMAETYFEQALVRVEALAFYFQRSAWPVVVREAQEAIELLLKASLRHVGVEPARQHDVAEALRESSARFPEYFRTEIAKLASISEDLGRKRGRAFYGDELNLIPPDDLFGRPDAEQALEQASFVRDLCKRLIEDPNS